ncbi:hypothetical protein L3Q82_011509 [Scortum barcoo]|uniref:Uncharacterized protein n=1 Tax=Scortum barcoo TaxID=214431 RepID=A0ACB8W538_9TELE|nr:hypothetical protein L3Q82_011509 [Scortum barcoo]
MKDDIREQAKVSRQELYEEYVKCYLQLPTEVRPCRDACLLKKVALYLQREAEPEGTFTVFPFSQAVSEGCGALSTDYRKMLSALIKAAELLETICINLFLQPWKKEIKTLKTFTGPFVYHLLPALSTSTIQSVLASIGYLPNPDTPQSEYRLCEDANPDRAMLVGFELLLARVECYHLLEKDQLELQEWQEVLQRRMGPTKLQKPSEQKTTIGQREEEEEEMKNMKKKEEADRKEEWQSVEEKKEKKIPLYLDTRAAVKPQSKPQHCHPVNVDQSIMEMKMTYPDLAFRGRPLVLDKPPRANSGSSSYKTGYITSTSNYTDDRKAADPPKRTCIKGTKIFDTTIHSKKNGGKTDEVFGDDGRGSDCNDRDSGGTTTPGEAISSSFSNSGRKKVDDELSGPQAISLHITLRAGSTAEQSHKPVEPPVWMQQQTAAGLQNKRLDNPEIPSLSSMDEEQELRELAQRMGQLQVQETKEEAKKKEENKRGEENTNKERKKKERKASKGGEAEEQNLRKPVMETGPALSHGSSGCTRSPQSDPAVVNEQKQLTVYQHSQLTVSTTDSQSCKEGGTIGQQEGEDTEKTETGCGEREQLAQSFLIVEHHKK